MATSHQIARTAHRFISFEIDSGSGIGMTD